MLRKMFFDQHYALIGGHDKGFNYPDERTVWVKAFFGQTSMKSVRRIESKRVEVHGLYAKTASGYAYIKTANGRLIYLGKTSGFKFFPDE